VGVNDRRLAQNENGREEKNVAGGGRKGGKGMVGRGKLKTATSGEGTHRTTSKKLNGLNPWDAGISFKAGRSGKSWPQKGQGFQGNQKRQLANPAGVNHCVHWSPRKKTRFENRSGGSLRAAPSRELHHWQNEGQDPLALLSKLFW